MLSSSQVSQASLAGQTHQWVSGPHATWNSVCTQDHSGCSGGAMYAPNGSHMVVHVAIITIVRQSMHGMHGLHDGTLCTFLSDKYKHLSAPLTIDVCGVIARCVPPVLWATSGVVSLIALINFQGLQQQPAETFEDSHYTMKSFMWHTDQ